MRVADDELRERARVQFHRPERFERTVFLGSLQGYRGNMTTGNIDITFSVGVAEKEEALKVTGAAGELLLITVERLAMRGGENGRTKAKAPEAPATVTPAGPGAPVVRGGPTPGRTGNQTSDRGRRKIASTKTKQRRARSGAPPASPRTR